MKKPKKDNAESGARLPSDKNKELVEKVAELAATLREYEYFNNFEEILAEADACLLKAKKAFDRLSTNRRLENYLAAVWERSKIIRQHKQTDIAAIEDKLKNFDSFIDKKYWDEVTLFIVEIQLKSGIANSVEQAISNAEKGRKQNKNFL